MPLDPNKALEPRRDRPVLSPQGALSTGSTLLNLACTGDPRCGFLKGRYYYLVGDSASGKTWLSLTCFAEAMLNKHFRDYRLIFDDVEGGALMDIEHYFGKEVAKRMQAPRYKKGVPVYSSTIEDFYYNLEEAIEKGEPFIYVLDSQDALDSLAAAKKFKKQRAASYAGEEAAGSYGDGKAKYHSEKLRHALVGIKRLNSILLIIGQSRDNPAAFGYGDKKTRSGGKALRFYATLEIWTSIGHKRKKTVRGVARTVGIDCIAEIKKNRVSGRVGKDRAVTIPIYYDLGIDDVGSCVDYLIGEGAWRKIKDKQQETGKQAPKRYDAKDLLLHGTRNELISQIEEDGLEDKLRVLTGKVWQQIEAECAPQRKRRYG